MEKKQSEKLKPKPDRLKPVLLKSLKRILANKKPGTILRMSSRLWAYPVPHWNGAKTLSNLCEHGKEIFYRMFKSVGGNAHYSSHILKVPWKRTVWLVPTVRRFGTAHPVSRKHRSSPVYLAACLLPGNANLPIGGEKAPIGRLAFPGLSRCNLCTLCFEIFKPHKVGDPAIKRVDSSGVVSVIWRQGTARPGW